MAQIFHRGANPLSKFSILGALLILAALAEIGLTINRSPYMTEVNVAREQPIPFSHKHHVSGLGIDCRYCHSSVEESAFAGIPATKTCMNCHSQIWADSPMLAPVRDSFRRDKPIEWVRVHDLPDFVYFDHSIHVSKGIGCTTCHGRVDQMPLTWREKSLHMEWCMECHRAPEKFIRPKDRVFDMNWTAPRNQAEMGKKLMKEYKVQRMTDCTVCHR